MGTVSGRVYKWALCGVCISSSIGYIMIPFGKHFRMVDEEDSHMSCHWVASLKKIRTNTLNYVPPVENEPLKKEKEKKLISGAPVLRKLKSVREERLHGGIMEQDATEDSNVPQVMAAAKVVKHAGTPTLGDLAGVDACAEEVDQQ